MPFALRIALAVFAGLVASRLPASWTAPMGDAGLLVIRLLKALAAPLVFVAVVDAFLTYDIPRRKGARLLSLSLLNASVAIVIGLGVAHALHAGTRWRGQIGSLVQRVASMSHGGGHGPGKTAGGSVNPLSNLSHYVPESLLEPFTSNNVISIVLLAMVCGIALRRIRAKATEPELTDGIESLRKVFRAALAALAQMLSWAVALLPFAVFAIVASVVAQTGVAVFAVLAPFVVTIVIGLAIHAFGYYAVLLRALGRRSPLAFYRDAFEAITTALSSGSSLATLPVTLKTLDEKLRVAPDSARLAACVGTNLNHDGIILYEASAAVFVAQALGMPLTLSQQIAIALAAVMAGVGIAGVPEAGLITLPLVLGSAGFPEPVVATMIPLLLPVDWIIGRCRATTNVLSDMTVAVILDRMDHPKVPATTAPASGSEDDHR